MKQKLLNNLMLMLCQMAFICSFANTIIVTNKNDSGAGSFRQAILDAVAGDTIVFAVTDTIALTTGELLINKRLTVIGPGASLLAIDGNAKSRLFHTVVPCKISGLTIQNGSSTIGGGILADDTLMLYHCIITKNYAGGVGGISSAKSLTVKKCEISYNVSSGNGGGIEASQHLIIDSCFITENSALSSGGGLYCLNSDGMSISNTIVSKCKAHTGGGTFEGGGGIYFSSCLNVKITNCIISENRTTGSGADGGGIYNCNYSDLNIRNCIISKNRAANTGGGYHGFSEGNLRIYNSSIYGNRAGPQGGGMMFQASALFEMDSCLIYNDTAIRAGGISIYGGGCRIANSSIYNNYARTYYGGGLVLSIVGGATLINNTISGNTAVTDGGGIWYQGRLILVNNTISNNLAGQDGDGLFLNVGIPELPDLMMNNIFSNQRNYACLNNCVAPNSLGGNISSDTSMNNFLIDPTDKNNTDPLLDTLAFNGGVVPTLALKCTSPAINAGKYYHTYLGLTLHDTLYSPIRDQRGFPRIGNHDIGALESGTRTNTSLSACDSYTWAANGNIIYTKSGIYTTTLASRAGCDSVVTLNLTINFSPVLTTSVSGITITADETGATYQWIDCSNNSKIIGATSQTFTATANGNYAVVVTNKNCSDTSLCVSITSVGISQYPNINSKITIYPNPNAGKFILVTERISKNYWVTDNIGKVVAQGIIKQKQTDIDLSNSKAGIYFIQIDGQYFKLVVQ